MELLSQGWLIKSPPERKLQSRLFKSKWRRRYFLLYKLKTSDPKPSVEFVLAYYENEHMKKRRGTIDLTQCDEVVSNLESSGFKYMFGLKTKQGHVERTYFLAADSAGDMDRWVGCLCKVLGLLETEEEPELPPRGAFSRARSLDNLSKSKAISTNSLALPLTRPVAGSLTASADNLLSPGTSTREGTPPGESGVVEIPAKKGRRPLPQPHESFESEGGDPTEIYGPSQPYNTPKNYREALDMAYKMSPRHGKDGTGDEESGTGDEPDVYKVPKGEQETYNVPKEPQKRHYVPKEPQETYNVPKGPQETYNVPKGPQETYNVPKEAQETCNVPPLHREEKHRGPQETYNVPPLHGEEKHRDTYDVPPKNSRETYNVSPNNEKKISPKTKPKTKDRDLSGISPGMQKKAVTGEEYDTPKHANEERRKNERLPSETSKSDVYDTPPIHASPSKDNRNLLSPSQSRPSPEIPENSVYDLPKSGKIDGGTKPPIPEIKPPLVRDKKNFVPMNKQAVKESVGKWDKHSNNLCRGAGQWKRQREQHQVCPEKYRSLLARWLNNSRKNPWR